MKINKVEQAPLNYLKTFRIHYTDTQGNERIWEAVSRKGRQALEEEIQSGRDHSDGTMIVAWDEAKEHVVLVKEFRVIAGKYVYAFPAGLSDDGESLEETAIREFREETGMNFHYLGTDRPRYTSVGLSNEKVDTVYGTFTGTPSAEFTEASEDLTPLIVDRQEAQRILLEEEVSIRSAFLLRLFFGFPMYEEN